MLIEVPRSTERLGSVRIHTLQKILELDATMVAAVELPVPKEEVAAVRQITIKEIEAVERDMAIVVPIRNEELKLFEGVLSGIPHNCLIIVASNSDREPADRYRTEKDTLAHFYRFTGHKAMIIHQKDPTLAKALKTAGLSKILGNDGLVNNGKAEGMIIGILLAKFAKKNYVGFIDADNYIPGAVQEYVRNYTAGFIMAKTPYVMVRNSWLYKPKILESDIYFRKWGRVSEVTNRYMNSMISSRTKFETEIIKTGNAGEHAMSMKLAEILPLASGFAVEPMELIHLLENFGGEKPSIHTKALKEGVGIFQIETRNPHFHMEKGSEHLNEMLLAAMGTIYHSPLCNADVKKEIIKELVAQEALSSEEIPPKPKIYPPLEKVKFTKLKHELEKMKAAKPDERTLELFGF
jgi:mannosyl-3-phosphoglycerate synthase